MVVIGGEEGEGGLLLIFDWLGLIEGSPGVRGGGGVREEGRGLPGKVGFGRQMG